MPFWRYSNGLIHFWSIRSWNHFERNTNEIAETLIIIDTLYPLVSNPSMDLPSFLYSLITPLSFLLAIYHSDIPLQDIHTNSYSPHPLTLLKYLSTTILIVQSLSQILSEKSAERRSRAPPSFGLAEGVEGVVTGIGRNDRRGTVVEMEHRRKSGRAVCEWFFLPRRSSGRKGIEVDVSARKRDGVVLLDDHPLYRALTTSEEKDEDEGKRAGAVAADATFSLELTEKQMRDRDGVVLPYFDAQREGDVGEGGRILYDMGVEDDFDEEEDEI